MTEGNGEKYKLISVTVDPTNLARLDAMVDTKVFRSRSHAIDVAIQCLLTKMGESNEGLTTSP